MEKRPGLRGQSPAQDHTARKLLRRNRSVSAPEQQSLLQPAPASSQLVPEHTTHQCTPHKTTKQWVGSPSLQPLKDNSKNQKMLKTLFLKSLMQIPHLLARPVLPCPASAQRPHLCGDSERSLLLLKQEDLAKGRCPVWESHTTQHLPLPEAWKVLNSKTHLVPSFRGRTEAEDQLDLEVGGATRLQSCLGTHLWQPGAPWHLTPVSLSPVSTQEGGRGNPPHK
jgi:hypothetical protein